MDILSYTEYDAVLLDIMMPKADGYQVLAALRASGKETPVLFLTARDAIEDRVRGLDSGACDYLVKPFSLEELAARVRAALRISHGKSTNLLTIDDLTVDCGSHRVTRGGKLTTFRKRVCTSGISHAESGHRVIQRKDRKPYLEF